MKKALISSIILIVLFTIFSILRFGFTLSGFMRGDGAALLAAISSLTGVWGLVVSFSITVIGITFQLSKLPNAWKIHLLKSHLIKKLRPFFLLALIAGIVPFATFLSIDTSDYVFESTITSWLILGFFLQILLIYSSAKAALTIYEELNLIPAIRNTLEKIDGAKLSKLKSYHKEAFKKDYEEDNIRVSLLMPGFNHSLTDEGYKYHDELVTPFVSLFKEHDPQILDKGVRIISKWLENKPVKELDDYFLNRIIYPCFNIVRTENSYHSPLVFQSRLYFLTKLIVELQNCGARLTASNSSNLIWTAIEEYANNNGIINALNLSENSLTELLKSDRKNNVLHSHLIENLLNSIPMLLKEGIHGLIWIEKISQYIQNRFEHIYNKNSKNARSYQEIYANNIIYIYQQIDQVYGNTPALWYGKDIKFWIIVNLRRSQESFVERIISTTMNEESKDNAEYIYNKIDEIISKLLSIRKPLGDVKSYVKSKYKNNPFR